MLQPRSQNILSFLLTRAMGHLIRKPFAPEAINASITEALAMPVQGSPGFLLASCLNVSAFSSTSPQPTAEHGARKSQPNYFELTTSADCMTFSNSLGMASS